MFGTYPSCTTTGIRWWLVLCLIVVDEITTVAAEAAEDGTCSADAGECPASMPTTSSESSTCQMYLAPSTIPNAGLGMFTTVDREIEEVVDKGDVLFPIVDLWYHFSAYSTEINEMNEETRHLEPLAHYIWQAEGMGLQHETAFAPTKHAAAFGPGLDAAVNCHPGLINLHKNLPIYDTQGLHRAKDPGAGAFTPYHGVETYATHFIPSGSELFKDYGSEWFITRTDSIGMIPLVDDWAAAEELVQLFERVFANRTDDRYTPEFVADLWKFVETFPFPSRTMIALPKDQDQYRTVVDEGIRAILQPSAMRSVEELEKTGRCTDHLYADTSTLRQAGRGAFTKRFLAKDSIITGSPLLVIQSDHYFLMFDGDWYTKKEPPNVERVARKQILYNYCLFHNSSSMFFCPYGSGVNYINHNKTLANVRLQWAPDGEMGHKAELLQDLPRPFQYNPSPGLFIDYVATRDIQPGEELFIDYGDEWEDAWWEHVANWGLTTFHDPEYQSARDWNRENEDTVLRTRLEQKFDPYPEHFELRCLPEVEFGYIEPQEAADSWTIDTTGLPCEVIQQGHDDEGNLYYKVNFKTIDEEGVESEEWIESEWLPRSAMRFRDVAYTTDLFLEDAFRQPIGFPDELFPEKWRDINWRIETPKTARASSTETSEGTANEGS